MQQDQLRTLLAGFGGKSLVVIGDCMLDEYLWGRACRISPEAPVMVVEHVDTTYAPGGASNVAANIMAMRGAASIVGVIGDDPMGLRLRHELERLGVAHEGLITHPQRPTTVKTRIIAHSQQVLRVDREERGPVSPEIASELTDRVPRLIAQSDGVLFADYNKGLLTKQFVARVLSLARAAGKPIFANPKPVHVGHFRRLGLVSVNQLEAEVATGLNLANLSSVGEAGNQLLRLCEAEAVLITLGSRGLALFERGKPWCHLPGVPVEVYDPCGCGDSALAAAALARTAGADWVEAATVANLAGSAKVRRLGVVPISGQEIEAVCALSHALSADGPHTHSGWVCASTGSQSQMEVPLATCTAGSLCSCSVAHPEMQDGECPMLALPSVPR
jgi:rfaE bifunctional protein kinase chain/domain